MFMIFGANLENVSLFSEVLQIDATIAYDTDNTAPYFPTLPADLVVGQGYTVEQFIGAIEDY